MKQRSILEELTMKKVTCLLLAPAILFLAVGCEEVNTAADSGPTPGEALIIAMDSDMNEPDWIDDSTLIGTTGYDDRIIVFDTGGNISRTIPIATDNGTILRMNLIAVSPDTTTASYHIEYEDESRDIATTVLATGVTTVISDTPGPYHGASYAGNDHVYFFSYDAGDTTHVTTLYKTPIASGTDEVVFTSPAAAVDGSAAEQVYFMPRANTDGSKVILGTDVNDGETPDGSYVIVDAETGTIERDLKDIIRLDPVYGPDWISATEILVSGHNGEEWNIFRVDLEADTVTSLITSLPDEVITIFGVNVSPDGSRAASFCRYRDAETGAEDNRLLTISL
jgi:hypothetical protein